MSGAALASSDAASRASARWRIVAAVRPGWSRGPWRWAALAVLLLIAGMPAVLGLWHGRRSFQTAASASGLFLLIGLWAALVIGVLKQNSAVAARTVPGHVARLREVLVGGWALLTVLPGAAAAAQGRDPLFAMALGGPALLVFAATLRWPLSWSVVWLVPTIVLPRASRWFDAAAELPGPVMPMVVGLLLTMTAAALAAMVRRDGAETLHRQTRHFAGGTVESSHRTNAPGRVSRLAGWLARTAGWPYHAWMRQLLARTDASVLSRIELVYRPSVHWAGHAFWLLVVFAIAGAVVTGLVATGRIRAGTVDIHHLWGPMLGLMSAAFNPLLGLDSALLQSRREQALLVLLPGVPRGVDLNRGLALRRLAHGLACWAAGAVVIAGLAMLASDPAVELMWLVVFGLLPVLAWVWPDYARMHSVGLARATGVVATYLGAPALCVALHRLAGVGATTVIAGTVAITGLLLAWRWRRLAAMPGAFPVGRLSGQR